MTTRSTFFLATAVGFMLTAPARAEDAAQDRSALASLHDVGSAGALFFPGMGEPAPEAAQRSRVTSLTVTFSTQTTLDEPDTPSATSSPKPPAVPVAALALPIGGARAGGTDLYGLMRDPRAVATTPAGLRLADPMVVQSIRPDLLPLAARKFVYAK
ncbi:MAG: hypothetical protein IT562_17910 [Alphaproteobacteria bacterium]|nr:hypothetical protein [Alphaproteobacteria bacterium]